MCIEYRIVIINNIFNLLEQNILEIFKEVFGLYSTWLMKLLLNKTDVILILK